MWRGHEGFTAVCSAYQFEAKIITISGENDDNPRVTKIGPNPQLANFSELPAGRIPEMVLLHEENSHYNLIIPRNCRLALDGGLDYQRKEQEKKMKEGVRDRKEGGREENKKKNLE